MYKKIVLVISVCCYALLAQAQQVPGKQLRFSDYRGIPDTTQPFKAFTICKVDYSVDRPARCADGRSIRFLKVTAVASFNPDSWIKDKRNIVPEHRRLLLYHEQGHLDVFKICAMELKRSIEQTCFSPDDYQAQLDSLYQRLSAKYDLLQRAYDEQTGHGTLLPQQAVWKQQIWELYQTVLNKNQGTE